jgi:phage gpG-like protein
MPPRPSDVVGSPSEFEAAAQRTLSRGGALIGGTSTTKYMRSGGTNVGANNQTGPGSLRRQTGRLARSLLDKPNDRAASEGIFKITTGQDSARLEYGSEVPYAAAHEYGLSERVNVNTHVRQQTHVFGKKLDNPMTVRVHAHSRMMNIPERPFLGPALEDVIDEVVEITEQEYLDAIIDAET